MYQLTGDICWMCEACKTRNWIQASGFNAGPNVGVVPDLEYSFVCYKCEEIMWCRYSYNNETASYEGLVVSGGSSTTVWSDYLDLPSLLGDQIYRSYIDNVSRADYVKTLRLIEQLQTDMSELRKVSRRDFEFMVAELIRRKGFEVEVTKQTRDGGKDIIAVVNNGGIPFKILVECKHPDSQGTPISVDLVRALYGVHSSKDGANKVIMVASSYFSNDARNFVKLKARNEWELGLYDYKDLEEWIRA